MNTDQLEGGQAAPVIQVASMYWHRSCSFSVVASDCSMLNWRVMCSWGRSGRARRRRQYLLVPSSLLYAGPGPTLVEDRGEDGGVIFSFAAGHQGVDKGDLFNLFVGSDEGVDREELFEGVLDEFEGAVYVPGFGIG